MQIKRLQVAGYRSIKNIDLKLHDLNVIVGANGTGKSNLYRSLYLIWAAANGNLASTIASEGGMPSALWAGLRTSTSEARVKLRLEMDELKYQLECGLVPRDSRTWLYERARKDGWFQNDPDIKEESVSITKRGKRTQLLLRRKGRVEVQGGDGETLEIPLLGNPFESCLASLRSPQQFPELAALRQEILDWRFYHHFRTDLSSPLRREQIPVYSPVLSHDGHNLASTLASIIVSEGEVELFKHLENAFPGAKLDIRMAPNEITLSMEMPGLNRPFETRELSDGTLQYLCLTAALLSQRPPNLLILNEPETSIHPDLFEALAELLIAASRRSQIIVTTHARDLAAGIIRRGGPKPIELEKVNGETRIVGGRLASFDAEAEDFEDED